MEKIYFKVEIKDAQDQRSKVHQVVTTDNIGRRALFSDKHFIASLLFQRLCYTEAYLEPYEISKMGRHAKIVIGF